MTRVDLIVPTFNGADLLRSCLRSLNASTFTDYQLWVVDDGSTEPIEPVVDAEAPGSRILRFETNVGLTRGLNAAIACGSAEYVVLLNNDTEVDPRWLEKLVACADAHPWVGSVASKMRLMSDRTRLHSAGDYYSVRGMPGNRGVWLLDAGQFDTVEVVFSACGGAALYRRIALSDVELGDGVVFDERLFMYCEDVDLGWRLWRAGWSCLFCPDAVVYHALSATAGGKLASYYVARNVWLVIARSVPRQVLPDARRVVAYHLGRLTRDLRHAREPAARASLRGTIAGVLIATREWRHRPTATVAQQRHLRSLLTDYRQRSALPGAATLSQHTDIADEPTNA